MTLHFSPLVSVGSAGVEEAEHWLHPGLGFSR